MLVRDDGSIAGTIAEDAWKRSLGAAKNDAEGIAAKDDLQF